METLRESLPFENPNDLFTCPLTPVNPPSPPPQPFQPPSEYIQKELSAFSRSLQAAYLNCESLLKNFHEFQHAFSSSELHVIGLSETWLKPSISNCIVNLPNYVLFRNDRTNKGGGGVAAYLHKSIHGKILSMSDSKYAAHTEFLIVEACINRQNILLCIVYRPPGAKFDNFEDELAKYLPLYQHILILGDTNYNLLNNKAETNKFRDSITAFDLHLLPFNATYHSGITESWLDVIITRNTTRVLKHGQISAPGISPKHDILFIAYSIKVPKYRPRLIEYRDLKNVNEAILNYEASLLPFHEILNLTAVDDKVLLLNSLIIKLYDKVAPVIRKRVKRPPAPWITADILRLMSIRDAAHAKYKRAIKRNIAIATDLFEAYRRLRNKCTQEVRKAKMKFGLSLEDPSLSNKALWKKLNSLGIGKTRAESPNINVPLDDLNDYFCKAPAIDPSLKLETIHYISSDSNPHDPPYFNFRPVSISEVEASIMRIKSPIAGVDNISITLVKKILPHVIRPITNIFNTSLATGTYPAIWKLAHVKPLPKITAPAASSDYRPISILAALSKALEHIVHKQISTHVQVNNLLDPLQSGFRTNHSTTTALLKITDDIRRAMDKRQLTILILLDFSKAFQTVDHDILATKLKYSFKFSELALNWIQSYLADRKQSIFSQNATSNWKLVEAGVPQGSVLGPLLFTLYTTDVTKAIQHMQHHLYADDLQCYITSSSSNINETIASANRDLSSIANWSIHHGLQINPTKSQAIIIGSRQNLSHIDKSAISALSINGSTIPFSNTVKNLGIILNSTLTWENHINSVCKRAYASLHPLHRLKHFLPRTVKERLTQTLVLSHLDYCDVVYDDCNSTLSHKLQRIQNSCIRFIFNLKRHDHVSHCIRELSWLKLNDRRSLHKTVLLHKILSSGQPSYLASLFNFLGDTHSLNTRSNTSNILSIPAHKSDFFSRSFSVSASRQWNSLSLELRQLRSIGIFKRKVKEFLLAPN